MRLAGRLALPITGQETSLGRAKFPLSRRKSLAYTELRSFGCSSAAQGARPHPPKAEALRVGSLALSYPRAQRQGGTRLAAFGDKKKARRFAVLQIA